MRNSFIVKLSVELGLKALAVTYPAAAWLFTGLFGEILGFFAAWWMGFIADFGIVAIDLTKDTIEVALQRSEYREAAIKAYKKATEKVHTEEEKREIRKQYLDAIRKFVRVPVKRRKP